MRRPVLLPVLSAVSLVLVGVLTNVATNVLPKWVQEHQAYAWPALAIVVLLMLRLLMAEKRHEELRHDVYEQERARHEQKLAKALCDASEDRGRLEKELHATRQMSFEQYKELRQEQLAHLRRIEELHAPPLVKEARKALGKGIRGTSSAMSCAALKNPAPMSLMPIWVWRSSR